MKSYDEELREFIHDMEDDDIREHFRTEDQIAPLLAGLGNLDNLTEPQFLEYMARSLRRVMPSLLHTTDGTLYAGVMQLYFDTLRRARNLGADLEDTDRYDLGRLQKWRGRPGASE